MEYDLEPDQINFHDLYGMECNELLIIVSHEASYKFFKGRMTEEEKDKYRKKYFPNDTAF